MWSFLKSIFYSSILIVAFTGVINSVPSSSEKNKNHSIELTKQGVRWKVNKPDGSSDRQQPCTYEVYFESNFKDMKEAQRFDRSFFSSNNLKMKVVSTCPEEHFDEKELSTDLESLLINYDDLTYEQKLVIDHKIKTGSYKSVALVKGTEKHVELEYFMLMLGKYAYSLLIINRVLSLLFQRFVIRNRQAEAQQ